MAYGAYHPYRCLSYHINLSGNLHIMEQKDLRELEKRWVQECAPACTAQCPVHVDVKAMIAAMCAGDFAGAADIFQSKVPFPEIISLVFDQPCRDVCRSTGIDATVSIRSLERVALNQRSLQEISITPPQGKAKKVAVVGAGLSGLTVALELTNKGYRITSFGGILLAGRIGVEPPQELSTPQTHPERF